MGLIDYTPKEVKCQYMFEENIGRNVAEKESDGNHPSDLKIRGAVGKDSQIG